MFISPMWDVKEPTHQSKRVGYEVPGVVAVLFESKAGPHQLIAAKTQPAQSNKEKNRSGIRGSTWPSVYGCRIVAIFNSIILHSIVYICIQ